VSRTQASRIEGIGVAQAIQAAILPLSCKRPLILEQSLLSIWRFLWIWNRIFSRLAIPETHDAARKPLARLVTDNF
jgi:ABC-type glycerol-3-phosphate transport system permease component